MKNNIRAPSNMSSMTTIMMNVTAICSTNSDARLAAVSMSNSVGVHIGTNAMVILA